MAGGVASGGARYVAADAGATALGAGIHRRSADARARAVAVHCLMGQGRTGTVLGGVSHSRGRDAGAGAGRLARPLPRRGRESRAGTRARGIRRAARLDTITPLAQPLVSLPRTYSSFGDHWMLTLPAPRSGRCRAARYRGWRARSRACGGRSRSARRASRRRPARSRRAGRRSSRRNASGSCS